MLCPQLSPGDDGVGGILLGTPDVLIECPAELECCGEIQNVFSKKIWVGCQRLHFIEEVLGAVGNLTAVDHADKVPRSLLHHPPISKKDSPDSSGGDRVEKSFHGVRTGQDLPVRSVHGAKKVGCDVLQLGIHSVPESDDAQKVRVVFLVA